MKTSTKKPAALKVTEIPTQEIIDDLRSVFGSDPYDRERVIAYLKGKYNLRCEHEGGISGSDGSNERFTLTPMGRPLELCVSYKYREGITDIAIK